MRTLGIGARRDSHRPDSRPRQSTAASRECCLKGVAILSVCHQGSQVLTLRFPNVQNTGQIASLKTQDRRARDGDGTAQPFSCDRRSALDVSQSRVHFAGCRPRTMNGTAGILLVSDVRTVHLVGFHRCLDSTRTGYHGRPQF